MTANTFPPDCSLHFHLLNRVHVFGPIFGWCPFYQFCFWCAFGVSSLFTKPKVLDHISHLFPKGFYSFTSSIKVHDLFWVNLCTSGRITLKFSFLPVGCPTGSVSLIEKAFFHWITFAVFVKKKNQISIILWVYF